MADGRSPRKLAGRKVWLSFIIFLVVAIGVAINVTVLKRASTESQRAQKQQVQQIAKDLITHGITEQNAKKLAEAITKDTAVRTLPKVMYRPEDFETATKATYAFTRQMSLEQYDAIYDASLNRYRATTSREQFTGFLKTINQKTGVCADPTIVSTSVGQDSSGMFVEQKFSRKCTNINDTKEAVVWAIVDSKAKLRGYLVSNPVLANAPDRDAQSSKENSDINKKKTEPMNDTGHDK